jgi:hypothetical protein
LRSNASLCAEGPSAMHERAKMEPISDSRFGGTER